MFAFASETVPIQRLFEGFSDSAIFGSHQLLDDKLERNMSGSIHARVVCTAQLHKRWPWGNAMLEAC